MCIGSFSNKESRYFFKKRLDIAKNYFNLFNNINFKKYNDLPKVNKVLSHHGIFLIYIDFNKFKTNKKSLMNYLLKKGLKVQFHYIPINEFKVFSIPKKLFKGAKKYKDST